MPVTPLLQNAPKEAAATSPALPIEKRATAQPKCRRASRVVLGAAVVALMVTAIIWGSERTPEPTFVTPPTSDHTQPPPDSVKREPRPVSRHFAWAPVSGASKYRVELFRGSSRIFATRTTLSNTTIPLRWKFGDRPRRLVPGAYVLYVWALSPGRAAEMIVQAKMVIRAT